MAVSVLDDLYNNLKKNNNSAQKSTSAAKTNTTPVSTKKTTTVSSNSGKTTTTNSNSLINTIKNFFSGLNQKASASMSSYNPNSGVFTSSAGSTGTPYTGANKSTVVTTNKAYNQPFTTSGTNYTTVPKAVTTVPKAYNEPFTATPQPKNTVSGTLSLSSVLNKAAENAKSNISAAKNVAGIAGQFLADASYAANKVKDQNGIASPITGVFKKTGEILNKGSEAVSNLFDKAENYINPQEKRKIDFTFKGKADAEPVFAKIKVDPDYAAKLIDKDGNWINYADQISEINGRLQTTSDPYQRKELNDQLKQLKEYQNDQNRLIWSAQYDYMIKNGASEKDLIEFKKAVNKGDSNLAERTMENLTSTVESFVGSYLKGKEAEYALASYIAGVDYKMSSIPDKIIDNAEELRQLSMQGASGMEKVVYELYDSMANCLYAQFISDKMLGSPNYVENPEMAKILQRKALNMSDISVFGAKVKENMDKGLSFSTAANNAAFHALKNDVTESIGGEMLANIITGEISEQLLENGLAYGAKAITNNFFAEAFEEGAEAALEPLIDKATLRTGMTTQQYLDQVLTKDTAYQMFMGGLGGGIFGAVGAVSAETNYNSNIQSLADSITIENVKDYNTAETVKNKIDQIISKADSSIASKKAAGIDTSFDEQQSFNAKMLSRAFGKRIGQYRNNHPYMDAIYNPNNNVDPSVFEGATDTILDAIAPDYTEAFERIAQLNAETNEANQKAVNLLQEDLYKEGVSISAADFLNLTDDQVRELELVNNYAKLTNKNVAFANMIDKNGQIIDGVYKDGQTVINPQARRGALSTMVHEFTHGTESSKYYGRLRELTEEYYGNNLEEAVRRINENYSTTIQLNDEGAMRELTAITTQDLLGNQDFVDRLVRYDTSLAYRLYEEIRYINEYTGDIEQDIEQNFMRAFSSITDSNTSFESAIQYSKAVSDLVKEGEAVEMRMSFDDAVDAVLKKTYRPVSDRVMVRSTTPDILINEAGMSELPMLMKIGHIRNAVGEGAAKNQHHLSTDTLKEVPAAMDNPVLIYYNDKNNSINMVLDLYVEEENGEIAPVVVAISPNAKGKYNNVDIDTNAINTIFDFENYESGLDDMLKNAIYPKDIKKEELIALRNRHSRHDHKDSSFNNNISDISDEVKNDMVELSKGTQLEDLGRQRDLMAIHNLSETNLLKSIDLGGFAVPSIAVIKDSIPHDNYGSISLVFDKSTIDPSRRENYVYGGDAWTGTYPTVEYHVDYGDLADVTDKIEKIVPISELRKLGNISVLQNESSMDDVLQRNDGNIAEGLKNNKPLQYAYLVDKGIDFQIPTKSSGIALQSSLTDDEFELLFKLLGDNGITLDTLKDASSNFKLEDIARQLQKPLTVLINANFIEKHPTVNNRRIEKGLPPIGLYFEGSPRGDMVSYWSVLDGLNDTIRYWEKGPRTEVDVNAFEEQLSKMVDQNDFMNWLNDLYKDMPIKSGIRNDKDLYTSSGNRRSFESLHDSYTLENIMRFMKKQAGSDSRGKHEGVFGIGAGDIQATQKIDFESIADIIAHEGMLQNLSDEEVETIIKPSMDRIRDVANAIEDIYAQNDGGDSVESLVYRSNNAMEFLKESIKKNTKEQMIKYYQKEFAPYPSLRMTEEQLNSVLDRIVDLKDELRNMPTRYFEAKPVRIVGLDEVKAAVIPSTASELLKQRLADHGINTLEYDPEVEGARTSMVNRLDDLKFSKGVTLEDLNDQARREFRNLDLASRRVNLKEDINSAIDDIVYNGEVSEASYNALRQDVIRSTMQQMDNPAWEVARDIRKTLGNNFGTLPRDGWDAIIADINDQYNLFDENYRTYNTYEDAQEFIKDYLSKAGEKYIYMSPVDTGDISQQEYEAKIDQKLDQVITMLKEGVANRINQTAIDNTLADALGLKDDSLYYQEMEDLAYQRGQQDLDALMSEDEKFLKAYEEATAGNYSPEALQQLEDDMVSGITIDQAKEETSVLKKVKKDTSKPIRTMKDIFYQVRQKIFDKGIAIRDLKNSKLSASYDMLLNAENRANYTILEGCYDENGHKVVDSLTEISKMIPEAQKNDFDYYMYHKHNIDAAKINKPVFFNFDAAKSQQIVNQYEMAHPEWKDVAQKYYDFNNYLLKRQVDAGVISQQTADLWKQIYPHYVPTKRALGEVDDGSLVETADPQVQSANKGTLYERTGGNSPIQPLDYAMAEHAKQIYKSSLFNNFARDYVEVSHAAATLFNEDHSFDEDIIEGKEDQVTKADEYTPATLIWYNNGDRMIVEIPQQIYDAIGPSQTPFNFPSQVPFLSWASSMRRNMITGANPVFWATNGLKDLQDIAFNSKYSLNTYMNLPRAYKQLLTNGEIANLYKSLGGDYKGYRSEEGVDQNDHSAFYNATIGKVVQLNDLIETAPRLAEFMSSLDHGDSLETAMYNAAEVTTNFKRGGDYAKWVNRNGWTFLNASIQGFDKQIRNVADAYDSKGWKGVAGYMAKANLLAGIPLIVINGLLHRDDKDYEQLSDYIKDNYYILWKYDDGKFVRIPKGRIANAYQGILTALYENGVELVGDDKAIDKAKTIWENTLESLKNVWEQIGINDPLKNNLFSPIDQTIKNEAWYGDPIVSTYMQKKNPEDQYDESTDLFSVWLGQKTKLSPKKINYLIDQYSGGVGDVILPMLTPKAETGFDDGTVVGKLTSAIASPFADKFTTDSVFKNQDVTDFFALDEELTKLANKEHASDEAKLASKYINSLQYQMNDLYAQKRQIYNDNSIPDSLKYEKAREVQRQIDALARFGLDTYDQIDMDGYYADLNGVSYYRNTKGEWSKVDQDKEAELDALNLTTKEKSDYFYVKNNISELREQVKADTPDGQDADYRAVTLDAIMNSDLTPRVQNLMYDSYYSGKITDNINGMDLTDEEKLALKMANATASSVKDANGKTISNSKALGIADAYADAGLLDDVFSYIAANGLAPSDFGLTKTVYGYSYDKMASEYQKIYGEVFGTGSAQNVDLSVINNTTSNSSSKKKTSYSKKSSGSSRSSKSSSSSKAQKAAEKARKKQIKALQKAAKALRKSNNNIFDLLYKMTSIKDTEANVKKIMQNAYKG